MTATSGFLLTALECTKFVFGRGSASGPHWGSLQCSPVSLGGLRGTTSKGEGRRGKRTGRESGRGRKQEGPPPLLQIPGSAPATHAAVALPCPEPGQ